MRRAFAIGAIAAAGALGLALLGGGGEQSSVDDAVQTADGAPRMLELYTPWCPSCASMKPMVEELAERCAGKGVRVEALDVSRDENEPLADRFEVRAVPTFLFLDAGGAEAKRLVGKQTMEELESGLRAVAGMACGAPAPGGGPASPAGKEG